MKYGIKQITSLDMNGLAQYTRSKRGGWEAWMGGATRECKDKAFYAYHTLNALHSKFSTLNSPMAVYEPQEYNQ